MRDSLRHPLIHPFSGWDVNRMIDERAEERGEHPFLIWEPFSGEHEVWSYRKFAQDSKSLAAGLAAKGIGEGDKVLIHMDNCPETVLAWYACARIGAVALTTNARAAGPELSYFAEHAGAVCALTQPKFAELVAEFCPDIRWMAVSSHDNGEVPEVDISSYEAFDSLYGDAAKLPSLSVDPMRDVGIQYTSGTTSRPKGVVWTHANALWGFRINAVHQDLRKEDVHLCFMPLFHTNAQAYSVGAALYAGASVVVQPRFSASRFWPVSLKHKCSWASVIPFAVKALMKHPVPDHHYYRLWGSAICEPPTDAYFRVRTIGWWGMTETMSHGIVGDVHNRNRSLMIGKPAPEYGVAVVDDAGAPCRPGEVGHLLIKGVPGVSLFKEYLNNPEATEGTYDDAGWFITGDRVILHEDGFIQFSDRDKDMLKVGGENVAASEIERVLLTFEEIAEVAVVAKKDAMLDEVPVAFILPEGGVAAAAEDLAERVLQACRENLADFKLPREIILLDEFPRSTLEKIAKAELRKQINS